MDHDTAARIAELREQRDHGSDYGPAEARELARLTGEAVQLPGTGSHDTHGDLDAILDSPDALLGEDGSLTPTRSVSEPPLVLATNFELLRVLEGHDLTSAADDGTKVRIRLYNTDELLKARRAAALTLEAETGVSSPGMTRAQAVELCQPLGIALARMRGTS